MSQKCKMSLLSHIFLCRRTFNKRLRRRSYRELGSILPSSFYSSGELSEEEIIFDKSVMERNQESSKSASPRTKPEASSGTSSYQSADHGTQEQETWTLTQTPNSAPLMTLLEQNDSARTEIYTTKEIPETNCPDSSFNATLLSDSSNVNPTETPPAESLTSVSLTSQASETEDCVESDFATVTRLSPSIYDLTDTDSSCPFTAQSRPCPSASSKQTNRVFPLSPHPAKRSFSLLPTASNESTPSVTMACDGTSSSTESSKTPVAARDEVLIAMSHDDEEMDNSRDTSESEELNVVEHAGKGPNKAEVVLPMRLNEEKESLTLSQCKSESSSGEVINTCQESEMKNVTSDAIIDIMGTDNDAEKMSSINETSNQGKLLLVRSGAHNELLVRSSRYIINHSSLVKFVFKIHTALQPQSQNRYRSMGGDV